MLEEVMQQRRQHVHRLRRARDPRVLQLSSGAALNTLKFESGKMKTVIMNSWRVDVGAWMNLDTLGKYWISRDWHKIAKSASNSYLQQLSGSKFLLRSSPCRSCQLKAVLYSPSLISLEIFSNSLELSLEIKINCAK
jgi:hypothetical protein